MQADVHVFLTHGSSCDKMSPELVRLGIFTLLFWRSAALCPACTFACSWRRSLPSQVLSNSSSRANPTIPTTTPAFVGRSSSAILLKYNSEGCHKCTITLVCVGQEEFYRIETVQGAGWSEWQRLVAELRPAEQINQAERELSSTISKEPLDTDKSWCYTRT